MPSYDSVKYDIQRLVDTVEIKDSVLPQLDSMARKIVANKARYVAVSGETGVPWQFIAAVHARESDCNWRTHLHNGDSLNARTHHVPANRPVNGKPPFTWEASAIDALGYDGEQNVTDWGDASLCYQLEKYNGFGYRKHGINSPYVWAGTNHYQSGKFTSDGVFDGNATDHQVGTWALIQRINALDFDKDEIVGNSRKLSMLSGVRNGVLGLSATYATADNFNVLPDILAKVQNLALGKGALIVLGVAGAFWALLKLIETMHVQDAQQGRYVPSGLAPVAAQTVVEPTPKAPE